MSDQVIWDGGSTRDEIERCTYLCMCPYSVVQNTSYVRGSFHGIFEDDERETSQVC